MNPNRNALACLLALSAILAGCAEETNVETNAATGPAAPMFGANATGPFQAIAECAEFCGEPTLAVDGDTVLVSGVFGDLVRITNGTIEPVDLPQGTKSVNDVLLQTDPKGRLWFSAMDEPGEWNYDSVRVARTEDHAKSWGLNQKVLFGVAGEPTGRTGMVDRQWLAFDPNGPIHLLCMCPGPFAAQIRTSVDDGKTWSEPRPVPVLARMGPVGPPVVDGRGQIIVPYLTGSTLLVDAPAAGIAVAVSTDKGVTWTNRVVATGAPGAGPQCCAWPHAAVNADGVHVAWANEDGTLHVATSTDLTAWKEAKWDGGTLSKQYLHPWPVALQDGRLALVWYGGDDFRKASLHVSVAKPGDLTGGAKPATTQIGVGASFTDHPYAAVAADGAVLVPFVDTKEGISVARWRAT